MRPTIWNFSAILAAGLTLSLALAAAAPAVGGYGLSLFGSLKYGPNFTHFDYADPQAPKGGSLALPAIGTFDTLNPFVIKGVPADGLGRIFDTLTVPAEDEPGSQYGLVAEGIALAPDRLSVLYTIRKTARFHQDDIGPAARQRPLRDRQTRPRAFDRLPPGRRLLGSGSAGQQGPL